MENQRNVERNISQSNCEESCIHNRMTDVDNNIDILRCEKYNPNRQQSECLQILRKFEKKKKINDKR